MAILTEIKLGAAVVAAGAIFAGGWSVESWRAAGALGAEKLAHQHDVDTLKTQWQDKLDAASKVAAQAQAERDAERQANDIARQDAQNAYQTDLKKRDATNAALAAQLGGVRNQLAAAEAAGRPAGGGGAVQQAGAGTACGDPSVQQVERLLGRALDLATRCVYDVGEQHGAACEAVAAWPR